MKIDVELRNIPDTEAAAGWAGGHTVIADRPEGKAGGMGLGFNGGQLLALALGGCFCNDLRYVAEDLGAEISEISVSVSLELGGTPLVATAARLNVELSMADDTDPQAVVDKARSTCMVSNSLSRGLPVSIEMSA